MQGAALAVAAFAAIVAPAQAAPPTGDGSGGVRYGQIGSFDEPTHVSHAPGRRNKGLLFVAEKGGRVMVVRNGVTLAKPFLDLSDRVSENYEQGLLSIAFHPRYARNGAFYLYFTGRSGDIEIVEFRRRRRSRVRAKLSSARRVITIQHSSGFNEHNGGQIAFGPDRLLYAAPGDGVEPPTSAQDLSSLRGKLLRIRPLPNRRLRKARPYRIPRGNPFVGRPGRDEIYATGLRNPWRFSFDALSGAIAIGDVGAGLREEINFRDRGQARGVNFGWPRWEGTFLRDESVSATGAVPPIHEYQHGGRCAVVGGVVVRDPRLTNQYGRYLHTDLCDGALRSLIPSQSGAEDDQLVGGVPPVALPYSFGEGHKRRVFLCAEDAVYRLDPR